MSRYFYVKITGGTSNSLYSIYYNNVITGNLAYIYPTTNVATGLTLSELTSTYGVAVQVPNFTDSIIIYNEKCSTNEVLIVGEKLEEIVCICITVIPIRPQSSIAQILGEGEIVQILYCPTGFYSFDKPVYDADGTSMTWNENNQYWEIIGFPYIDGPIRSFDPSDEPLTGWEIYGECSKDYIVRADQCSCPDPETIYYINCDVTNPTCLENKDGAIISYAIGGAGDWIYSLDGINYEDNNGLFSELYAGPYTVYAMDMSGTVTTCSVLLEAPIGFSYPLAINVTQADSQSSTIAGTKFYQLNFSIDPSGLPSGVTLSFKFNLYFDLSYTEPGQATFVTTNSKIFKNSSQVSMSLTSNQTLTNIGPTTCGTNNIMGGFDEYTSNDAIIVTNSDFVSGYIVYGINTDSLGVYEDPCTTRATVNVTASLKDTTTSTLCDSVATANLQYSRTQTFSGTGINDQTFETNTVTPSITITPTLTPSLTPTLTPTISSGGGFESHYVTSCSSPCRPVAGCTEPGVGCLNPQSNQQLFTTSNTNLGDGVHVYLNQGLTQVPPNTAVYQIGGSLYTVSGGVLQFYGNSGDCPC